MTKTLATLSDAARTAVMAIINDAQPGMVSRRSTRRLVIAYVPITNPSIGRITSHMKPEPRAKTGAILVEWLAPHPDALSISGYYLQPSDEMAPESRTIWVFADENGQPDFAHLMRDGGGLAKALKGKV